MSKYKKYFLFVILALLTNSLIAQIKFNKKVVNLGTLEEWIAGPVEYEFVNDGNRTFQIIHAEKTQEIRVTFPREEIQPGQKGVFSIHYSPYKIGTFYEKILVYTNLSAEPTVLVMKGKLKSLINCPKVNQEQSDVDLSYIQEGLVTNRKTGDPIWKASVELKSIDESYLLHTSREGKFRKQIKLGLYHFKIEAEGYYPHEESVYLKKNSPLLHFQLDPIEIVSNEIPEVEPDPEPAEEFEIIIEEENPEDPKNEKIEIEEPETIIVEEKEKIEPEDKKKPDFGGDISITPAEYLPRNQYSANNIVFLVDISSSMNKQHKLSLLKSSMIQLTKILRDIDYVTLITYSTKQNVVFTSISADQKDMIIPEIDSLTAQGFTFGIRGLNKAYEIAKENYIEGGNNQIIVATDGEFNSPDHSEVELISMINKNARDGTIISVIGFGNNTEAIKRMKRMARFGKGNYLHIGDVTSANSILVEEIKMNSKKVE